MVRVWCVEASCLIVGRGSVGSLNASVGIQFGLMRSDLIRAARGCKRIQRAFVWAMAAGPSIIETSIGTCRTLRYDFSDDLSHVARFRQWPSSWLHDFSDVVRVARLPDVVGKQFVPRVVHDLVPPLELVRGKGGGCCLS